MPGLGTVEVEGGLYHVAQSTPPKEKNQLLVGFLMKHLETVLEHFESPIYHLDLSTKLSLDSLSP